PHTPPTRRPPPLGSPPANPVTLPVPITPDGPFGALGNGVPSPFPTRTDSKPPPFVPETTSTLPSPSKSPVLTADNPPPQTFPGLNVASPLFIKITTPVELFTITRSGWPSPLMSATVTACGPAPISGPARVS